jgi:predicted nucleic acid-binding protein
VTRRLTNASPLVFLAKLDRLDLLCLGVQEVLVPSAVLEEVRAKRDDAAQQAEARLTEWLRECPLTRPELLQLLPDLGAGEREVLAQALQESILSVALDDLDARRTARRVGLEPIGTVGLLLAARKRGMLPSLTQEMERLGTLGFRISAALSERALREAGEL